MAEEKVDVEKMLKFQSPEESFQFDAPQAILYALGLGFSKDPTDDKELQYTYEMHENFSICPSFGCVMKKAGDFFKTLKSIEGLPDFNPMMLLHGEEKFEIYRPLKPNTTYYVRGGVADVADKKTGMLLTFESNIYEEEDGKRILAYKVQMSAYLRKLGGFGYKGKGGSQIPKKPTRKPDLEVEEQTSPNQAILYRLSGDFNPLHIDPQMAEMGNFPKPILHGMCFYGLATKLIIKFFGDYDQNFINSLQARFTSHVFPGETLIYSFWRDDQNIIFTARTKERGIDNIIGVANVKLQSKL